jgi:hypothetical protein
LEEVFATRLTVDFDNAIVRCFGGVDERDFPPGKLTKEIYEQAVCQLHTFAFVGHQENASEAFSTLQQRYSWRKDGLLPSVNLGKSGMPALPKEPVSDLIRQYNQWDCLLYQEILRLFPRPDCLANADRRPGQASAACVPVN